MKRRILILLLSLFIVPHILFGNNTPIGISIYEKYKDAICDIETVIFFKNGKRSPTYIGTGFLIDYDGHLVTADHVVRARDNEDRGEVERYEYTITCSSKNRTYNAKFIGGNRYTDAALLKVLKIDRKDYTPVKIGDPAKLKVGQRLWAIGNPKSLANSLTSGVISFLHRQLNAHYIEDFIQTDCPINGGNSGCPVFNENEEVVGIVQRAVVNADGLAFAMSIDLARIDQLKNGYIKVPEAGFESMLENFSRDGTPGKPGFRDLVKINQLTNILDIDDLTAITRETYDNAAMITSVEKFVKNEQGKEVESPAYKSGLEKGDVVVKIDDKSVKNGMQIRILLMDKKSGEKIRVDFRRVENGIMINKSAELELVPRTKHK